MTSGTGGLTDGLASNLENNVGGLADGTNNLNDGLGTSTNLADNLRSGPNVSVENNTTGLSNFANNVGEATTELVNDTSKGIKEIGTGVKNVFN